MKIHNFISIILLLLFAVALVQCSKDSSSVTAENENMLELRSFSDNCLTDLAVNCFERNDTIDLSIDQFSGCLFRVQVKVQKCYVGDNEWTYNISDFNLLSHNCPRFDSIIQNSNQEILEYFTYNFSVRVRNALTNYYLVHDIQPNGGIRASINHYFASCVKTCFFEVWDSDPKHPTLLYIGAERVNCGVNCCEYKTVHQLINGTWVLQSKITIEPSEPCSQSSSAICGRGTIWSTTCMVHCGGPDL